MNHRIQQVLQQAAAPQIAQPLNDIQLLAILASHRHDLKPTEAVDWAAEILAESIGGMRDDKILDEKLAARMRRKQLAGE